MEGPKSQKAETIRLKNSKGQKEGRILKKIKVLFSWKLKRPNGLKGQILFQPSKYREKSTLSHTQIAQLMSKRKNTTKQWVRVNLSECGVSKGSLAPIFDHIFGLMSFLALWAFRPFELSAFRIQSFKFSVLWFSAFRNKN